MPRIRDNDVLMIKTIVNNTLCVRVGSLQFVFEEEPDKWAAAIFGGPMFYVSRQVAQEIIKAMQCASVEDGDEWNNPELAEFEE